MPTTTLDDILITEELACRPSRPPDYQLEADAVAALTTALTNPDSDALQALADAIVAMGIAESAGVSLRTPGQNEVQCFWRAVSGLWHDYIGTILPLDQTPCGIVIERNTALLFEDPGRYFSALTASPDVKEILMVPLHVEGQAAGAVWAVAHDRSRLFEQEDVRLLLHLAALASMANRLEKGLRQCQDSRAETSADLERTKTELAQLVEGVPLLLWRAGGDGRWTWASPQWTRFTGQEPEASLGLGWLEPVHPDDRRLARQAWRLASYAEAFEVKYRLYDLNAGRYRWFQTRASPVYDDSEIVGWLGTSTDIDDLQTARERQRDLFADLQHRVRNTLAVVRSIARRTAERSESLEDFQMHFNGRLDAFARAQSFATSDAERGVDLETLIIEELYVHHARQDQRVTIAGPEVRLAPKIADAISLVIHELAVNAVKYGGLGGDDGLVEVRWTIKGSATGPVLALTWFDTPPDRSVERPTHHGFGRELIESGLVYDFDAVTDLSIGPDGARCEIRLPLRGPEN